MRRLLPVLVVVGAVLVPAGPAAASCPLPPYTSAHAFTGTVTEVRNGGRTATVRTDDGRTVTMRGNLAADPDTMTSDDRTFRVGGRYEFHPTNDSDPYQDNDCTATHELAAAGPAGPSPAVVAARPVAFAGSSSNWTLGAGGFVLLVLAVGVVWRLLRRPHQG